MRLMSNVIVKENETLDSALVDYNVAVQKQAFSRNPQKRALRETKCSS